MAVRSRRDGEHRLACRHSPRESIHLNLTDASLRPARAIMNSRERRRNNRTIPAGVIVLQDRVSLATRRQFSSRDNGLPNTRRSLASSPDGFAAHEPHDHTNQEAIRASNALAPDYLWVALGAPHEQAFVEEVTPGLFNIGVIRMSGYIHVSDLAAAHVSALKLLLEGHSGGAFNLGTGNGFSVREILAAIAAETGREVPHVVKPRRSGDPTYLVADPSAARATLNFRPAHSDVAAMTPAPPGRGTERLTR